MFSRTQLFPLLLLGLVSATTVTVKNACTASVDPAYFPAANGGSLGGSVLAAGASTAVTLPSGYSGRIWGRTGCDASGTCTTGGCPGGVNCTGPSTTGPTLAQFTINGFSSLDFFNPTVGDGFNIAVTIIPGSGCSTSPVSCTSASGAGNGCGNTATCPTGTNYTVQLC